MKKAKMPNEDIRMMLLKYRLCIWQVADRLGVCAETLSRWLRKEMPEDKRERVIEAIKRMQEEV